MSKILKNLNEYADNNLIDGGYYVVKTPEEQLIMNSAGAIRKYENALNEIMEEYKHGNANPTSMYELAMRALEEVSNS